jgi:lysophospholipase L1-like esterase
MNAAFRLQAHAALFALAFLTPLAAQEPTNAAEAAAKAQAAEKKAAREAAVAAKYDAWVATLPPAHQAWEKVLQANLGSFYLPGHQADKVAGKANAWDYVADNPKFPRVLLIGDSVSRGYTLAVRAALAGRANVHRAPENCGGTSRALTKLDIWLGEGNWDVIHFNFGIHDRGTPTGDYAKRLEQIVARLRLTGATLIWASTTPIPDDPAQKQTAASIVERNQIAAEVMARHRIPVDDLFGAVSPKVDTLRLPAPNVHFKESGYDFLGQTAAAAIAAHLPGVTK